MSLKTNLGNILTVATLAAGVTVAVDGAVIGLTAAQEGIERFFGAKTQKYTGVLKPGSVKPIYLPNCDGLFTQGTFRLPEGLELTVLDAPVITEGKYWPIMKNLVEGQNYEFTTFNSGWDGHRFVKADKL